MIVTKRESIASLIHDTSPTLRHSLQRSHNKACIMDSEMLYFLVWSLSSSAWWKKKKQKKKKNKNTATL